MRKNMQYKAFGLEEFLSDEKFQDWVLKGSNNEFWTQWILENTNKHEIVEEAISILKSIRLNENRLPEEHIDLKWSQLKKEIERKQRQTLVVHRSPAKRKISLFKRNTTVKWAAVVSILLIAGVASYQYLFNESKPIAYVTTYGEKKEVVLPDGSVVKINANSKITLDANWNEDGNREVYLTYGEAFFKVQKTPLATNPKFVVHAKNLDIAVLGTAFNVNSRRERTTVALKEGVVNLNTREGDEKTMKPGEIVAFSEKDNILKNVYQDQYAYLSWLDNRIILDNTSLQQIALLIEDHFGKKVEINDKSLQHRVLAGTVSDGDINIVIRAIESSLNTKAIIKHDKIIFN